MQTQKAKNNIKNEIRQNLEEVKEPKQLEDLSNRDLALSPLLAKTLYIA